MNAKKNIRKHCPTTYQRIKYCLFILLTLILPTNYLGLSFNPQNDSEVTINSRSKLLVATHLIATRYEANSSNLIHNASDRKISTSFVIFSVLTSVVSTVLLTMIWKYLDDLPGAKQSVLLYLYKDTGAIMFITQWIWFTLVIACFLRGGSSVGELLAKIISFLFAIMELQLLLTLNAISVLRLAMVRQNVVDPEMPGGVNETKSIRNIRYISFLCVSILASVMFLSKSYPHHFYYLLGDELSLLHLPNSALIFAITLVFLSALPLITAVMINLCIQDEDKSQASRICGYKSSVMRTSFLVIIFVIAIAICYGFFRQHFKAGSYIIVGQLLVIVACVLAPLVMILRSHPLRSYVTKTLSNSMVTYRYMIDKIMSCPVTFIRRSRRIHDVVV